MRHPRTGLPATERDPAVVLLGARSTKNAERGGLLALREESACAGAAAAEAWAASPGCSIMAAWKMARASGSPSLQSLSNSVTSFLSKLRLVSGATFLSMMAMMSFRSFWHVTSLEK